MGGRTFKINTHLTNPFYRRALLEAFFAIYKLYKIKHIQTKITENDKQLNKRKYNF